jgi:hypothetical protein
MTLRETSQEPRMVRTEEGWTYLATHYWKRIECNDPGCAANVGKGKAHYHRVGQLNWLVRGTRPDLAFVVHKLSHFCQQPYVSHWTGVRRVFRYLSYSKTLALRYTCASTASELMGYSDADFATDKDRHSTMGYVYSGST